MKPWTSSRACFPPCETMKKVVVVTGGSHGIGKATAQLFAAQGHRVYELSRSGQNADGILHITADLTDEQSVAAAFQHIAAQEGRLDILVNNAGFGISGAAELTTATDAARLFNINFGGVHRCVCAAVPIMRPTGGRIVNISSVGAVFAIPFQSFYSASKAAVSAFSLALANELRPFRIDVCALLPGDVRTDFTAAREKSSLGQELYGNAIETAVSAMERDEQNGMAPERLARAICHAALKRRCPVRVTVGLKYKLFLLLDRLLPIRLVNWIVKLLYS